MCPGDAMLRQVTEAVSINKLNPTLNAKEGWGKSNKLRERRNVFEFMDLANLSLTNSARTQRSVESNTLTEGRRRAVKILRENKEKRVSVF